jgi:hypothetical protein
MAFTSDAADAANHYQWRLSKPRAQTKLQPLDFAAMDQLFGKVSDLPELESPASERPLPSSRRPQSRR